MSYTYWLPDEKGNKKVITTDSNSVIIIGANGSGKSKLGAWIEQKSFREVHRIGAQRNLNFSESIPLKSYSEAEDFVLYGTNDTNSNLRESKSFRWNWGKSYTTTLMNDFDNVLAALIGLKNLDNDNFVNECKKAEKKGIVKPHTPITAIDKIIAIWDRILPQRKLRLSDSKFLATVEQNGNIIEYSSTQMSDGERAVLYLAAQVLCVPENKILIIDEPEIHLHRSIMNRLWKTLEEYRPDCLFIYITHDTQFAAMHGHADKIWIKEFDGYKWEFEEIRNDNLPEELLIDILGSRSKILFVEGENGSYDSELYTMLYPNYLVISCGSCSQVIARTKAFRATPSLHEFEVYGLIDRDYRSDNEIGTYKRDNIYTLQIAEVENLFIVEELVRFMARHLGKNADEVFSAVSDFVINMKYANMINCQICQSVVAEIKYQLSCIDISSKNVADAKTTLNEALSAISYDSIKKEQETKFHAALSEKDYKSILRVFNAKELSKNIGKFIGLDNKQYTSTVINLLRGNCKKQIIEAIVPYLPPEIPR